MPQLLPAPGHPLRRRLAVAWRDEEGSMVIFGMFLFVMMLIVAGMAVDIMRFESNRTRLQSTLDRSVLAAADLDQTRDATTVVNDYFRSAGMLDRLSSVTVTQTFNSRRVSATAAYEMPTFFMDMVGVDTLQAPAGGTASEAVTDIEIVLVLDISGSMVQNNSPKLANLQAAAREFVQSVLQNDTQSRISIALVPFNGQVMIGSPTGTGLPGTVLRDRYTGITGLTGNAYAYCVDLPSGAYGSPGLSTALAMPATTYANTWDFASGITDSNGDMIADTVPNAYTTASSTSNTIANVRTNMWCPPVDSSGNATSGNVVRLPSHSISALQTAISGLRGVGATSINAGMRWGLTLLDPASRPMFTTLIGQGAIPSAYQNRPYNWNQQNTLKVIVLMTDGENFPEERVNAGFQSGTSDIWKASDGNYSIFHPSKVNRTGTGSTLAANIAASRPFWVPHLAQWHSRPWIGVSPNTGNPYIDGPQRIASNTNWRIDTNGDGTCTNAEDGRGTFNNTTQACWPSYGAQTWQQVWASQRMTWVAQQLYARPLLLSNGTVPSSVLAGFRTQMDLFRSRTGTIASSGNTTTGMDSQLSTLCAQARQNRVVVYGIAFEAPTRGQQAIYNCASSPGHYFNAQGLQISTAFRAIAAQINALRLVN